MSSQPVHFHGLLIFSAFSLSIVLRNPLIMLASTFVTEDIFWIKVKCFMSDLFLSLLLSVNAKTQISFTLVVSEYSGF